MSERTRELEIFRSQYLGKSPATLLKDFPRRTVRILFPGMSYTQDCCKHRINVVVIDGKITRLWIG
jgi:hypothetical protein